MAAKRTVHVFFRLTRAEKAYVRKAAEKGEAFSETYRRLLLIGARLYEHQRMVCAADTRACRQSVPGVLSSSPDREEARSWRSVAERLESEKGAQASEIERLTAETERLRAAYEGSGVGLFLKWERELGGVCQACGGIGQVPDERVTSGRSPCPRCLGTGYVAISPAPTERPTDG